MAEIASAFVSILPSTRNFGSTLNRQVSGATRSSGTLAGAGFGKSFLKAFAAIGIGAAVVGFVKDSVSGYIDHNKVLAITANTIKTTGGAANVSAKQVGSLSDAIERATGVDGDAVQGAANLLLTFTNLKNQVGKGNDVFNQATKIVTDMSVALGTDAKGSAIQVGKALNDPIKGVTALTKVGVSFTDQQKSQIETLVDSGNTLGAQKIILGELGKEFGGAAKAAKSPTADLTTAFHALQDQVGAILLPVFTRFAGFLGHSVVPGISSLIAAFQNGTGFAGQLSQVFAAVTSTIKVFVAQLQTGTGVGGQVAAVFTQIASVLATVFGFIQNNQAVVGTFVGIIGAAAIAAKAYAAAQLLVNIALTANPIGIVVVAIAALAAGLVYAYKNSDRFRAIVDGAFKGIKKVVSAVINYVVPFVKAHWGLLVSIIGGPVALVAVLVIKHFGTIKKIVGEVASFVVSSAKKYAEFASAVAGFIANMIGKFTQFASAVRQKIGNAISTVKELPGKIKAAIGNLGSLLVHAGEQIIEGLIKGIGNKLGALGSKLGSVGSFIKAHKGPPAKDKVMLVPAGQMIMDGLIVGINSRQAALGKTLDKVGKKLKDKMKDAVDKATETLKSRRDDLQGLFDGIASGVTSNLGGNLFEGVKTAGAFISSLTTAKSGMNNLLSAFSTLKGFGLSSAFLSQLFQSGGSDLILSLAAGGQDQATQAANLFGDVTGLTADLSNRVAKNDPVSDRLDTTNTLLTQLVTATGKTAYDLAEAVNNPAKKARKRARK